MAMNKLQRWLAPYRTAYRNSALHRFLAWWGAELARLLPVAWRDWFIERRDAVQVMATADGWSVTRLGSLPMAAESVATDAGAEVLRALAERMLQAGEIKADLVALLDAAQVLERRLPLPAAAEENLAQVIAFELDRQTPFRADQVRYDFRIGARDAIARQIQVDMMLVPRPLAEQTLAPLTAAGLALDALDAVAADGARRGFNLLPAEARAERANAGARLNWILVAVGLGLLWLVMRQSIVAREQALTDLQQAVDKVQVEAAHTTELKRKLTDAVDGANFLAGRKKQHPVAVNILRELTQLLPKNTALVRLSVNRGEVQIQGNSDEAAQLIAILQKAHSIEGPAIQGAITPDARTRKEQFLIQAKVRASSPESAHAATAKS